METVDHDLLRSWNPFFSLVTEAFEVEWVRVTSGGAVAGVEGACCWPGVGDREGGFSFSKDELGRRDGLRSLKASAGSLSGRFTWCSL
jgi:hypothetical protein